MARNDAEKFVAALRETLENEARALRERRYRNLAALNEKKERLLAILEEKFPTLARGGEPRALIESLEDLTRKARENAEQLAIIRRSVANARARLEALAQAEKDTGLYASGGRKIEGDGSFTITRSI